MSISTRSSTCFNRLPAYSNSPVSHEPKVNTSRRLLFASRAFGDFGSCVWSRSSTSLHIVATVRPVSPGSKNMVGSNAHCTNPIFTSASRSFSQNARPHLWSRRSA